MATRTKIAIAVYSVAALLAAGLAFVVLTDDDGETNASPTTTTAVPTGDPWPLTGVASAAGDPLDRPAVAIKVSNSEAARPQAGINEADQVWEEQVEGISRLIAVFHSQDADPVGPVRSARDSDVDLLGAFGTPVFVWGGANEGVAARVESSPLISFNVDPDAAENKFRDDARPAPDNLLVDGTAPFFEAQEATPPTAQFAYREPDTPATGEPSLGARVDWGGSQVAYLWDGTAGWSRFQDGTPHIGADGTQVAPANVVILLTEYGAAPSDPRSPVAVTTGEGEATVLTDGRAITARWRRSGPETAYSVTDAATGEPVALTPGPTWVALVESGRTSFLDEAGAEELRADDVVLG